LSTPATVDLVARAQSLQDLAREHADYGEQARQLHPAVVEALGAAGLFSMLVPRELGGLEVDVLTMVRAIEAVARGDGAAGWCVMIAATTGVTAAQLPRAGAEEMFSDPNAATGGVLMPKGRATRVDGGWRVSGQWAFGSGSGHARWLLGGSMVFGPDGPELLDGKVPHARMMFFPRDDVVIHDTWHVSGLRGTGSNDFEVRDVFVPERRSCPIGGGEFWTHGPTYAFPIYGLLALGVASAGLGIAQGAIDAIRELATAKTPTGSRRLLSERAAAQSGIAEAEALVRSGRAFMHETVRDAWDRVVGGDRLTLDDRALLRLAATTAALNSAKAVDLCYNLGGASSIYESNTLQRQFRDVHTMTQHVMVGQPTLEVAGRIFLGMPTDTSMF
jgi:alkylation response protein AidB-like acyl-CoA dehydrogenase